MRKLGSALNPRTRDYPSLRALVCRTRPREYRRKRTRNRFDTKARASHTPYLRNAFSLPPVANNAWFLEACIVPLSVGHWCNLLRVTISVPPFNDWNFVHQRFRLSRGSAGNEVRVHSAACRGNSCSMIASVVPTAGT